MRLVDHHCHGVVRRDLGRAGFEALLSEGGAPPPGATNFDTPLGLAVRRHCGPLLDLAPHAPPEEYLERRADLGTGEVTRRFLRAAGTAVFCVDTGHRPDELLSPTELAAAAGPAAVGREVVRLETVARVVARDGAAAFARRYPERLAAMVAQTGAVAVKSIAAYRSGLELTAAPPSGPAVTAAVDRWLAGGPVDPVLDAALVWAAVELGLPIQFHVGYGDRDLTLHRSDPSLLTAFLRAAPADGPVLLLHCYPYHRSAAYLAGVYGNVYLDVGLALNHVGPSRARAVLAEALEAVPFGKMLYSSDAYGLPELYALGALTFRRSLERVLDGWVSAGECTPADTRRIAELIGSGNAERVYGLTAAPRRAAAPRPGRPTT
jgi:predicted TIM-barrel fold metal-dependent hydrolase